MKLYFNGKEINGAASPSLALLPTGGSANQVLTKSSSEDYETAWKSIPEIGIGFMRGYALENDSMIDLGDVEACTFGNGIFVLVAWNGTFAAYSYDGLHWYKSTDFPTGVSGGNFSCIANNNSRFVAINTRGDVITANSSATTWTKTKTLKNGYRCITYGNGLYVAGGENGTIAYSSDGESWSEISMTSLSNDTISGIAWNGNDRFVAVTNSGNTLYSSNGKNWYIGNNTGITHKPNFAKIAYGNGKYVVISSNEYIAYSTTGYNVWRKVNTYDSKSKNNIIFLNGYFIIIQQGTTNILYSSDAITWKSSNIGNSANYYGIAHNDHNFIITSSVNHQYLGYFYPKYVE